MKAWKVILAALVIFSAGAITGGLVIKLTSPIPRTPPPRSGQFPAVGHPRPDFLGRMQRELNLTAIQRQHIEQLLRGSQDHIKQLYDTIAPPVREEHLHVREQIKSELTPEQRNKFEEVFKPRGSRKPGGDSKSGEGWRNRSEETRNSKSSNPGAPSTREKQ